MRSARFQFLMLSVLLVIISGCATISKEQCELGDWYQVGLADGQQGKENLAADYSKDCAEYKVSVDITKYNKGRNQGLTSYCSYENGALVGEQGAGYNKVCPSGLSAEFLAGYRPHFNVANTENKLREKRIEASRLEETAKSKDVDSETKSDAKANLKVVKQEINDLNDELSTYEYELAIHKLDREIMLTERKLEDAKNSDKPALQARLGELKDNKKLIEDMRITEDGIKTIKNVIDLFK